MKNPAAGARSLAAYAVARILREGVTLDAALHDALAAAPAALGPSVRSLSYGAVRGYFRHEAILGRLLTQPVRSLDPLLRALLSVALFELEDARTPEYAVVDAAVKTAKATDAARPAVSSTPCCDAICASARHWIRRLPATLQRVTRRPSGWPTGFVPIGRCAGPNCWPPATRRRRCGCASTACSRRPSHISNYSGKRGLARMRKSVCRWQWCWIRLATCTNCRGSPLEWCPSRTWVPSASRFRWRWPLISACSTRARRREARLP